MSEGVAIILTGQVLSGYQRENVITALISLLKIDEPKAASLLAGRETVIKRNVAVGDIDRYLRAFTKIGAASRFEAAKEPPFSSSPASGAIATSATSDLTADTQPRQSLASNELTIAPGWSKPDEERGSTSQNGNHASQMAAGSSSQARTPFSASGARPSCMENFAQSTPVYSTPPVIAMSTEGRIGRLRYMAYYWPTMGLLFAGGLILALLAPKKAGAGTLMLAALVGIVFVWTTVRVMALRLHDLNRSGKWVLLPFLLAGMAGATRTPGMIVFASGLYLVILLAMLVWPGSSEDNDYGPPAAPNTNAVYVGALAFILFSALSMLSTNKYGSFSGTNSAKASGSGSSAAAEEANKEAMIRAYVESANARTPIMMNASIRLDSIDYTDKVLRYKATLMDRGVVITDDKKDALAKALLGPYCGQSSKMKSIFPDKITTDFDFRYQVTNWDYETFTIRLVPEKCG